MLENPRRGRQARNFTTNAPKIIDLKSSSEQIFSRKLPLGAPDIWNVVVASAVGNWISARESMGWTYLFDAKMSKDNQSCFPWINIRREDIDLRWMARTSLRTADAFPVFASLSPKNSVCEPEQQNDFP